MRFRLKSKSVLRQPGIYAALFLVMLLISASLRAQSGALTITPGFAGKISLTPTEQIALTLSRPLQLNERIAVVIGQTDLSSLFTLNGETMTYQPSLFPLPPDETEIIVYLVVDSTEWQEIARFPITVSSGSTVAGTENTITNDQNVTAAPSADAAGSPAAPESELARRLGFEKFDFLPSLNLGVKSQFAETHFPDSNRPERTRFTDATLQGTVKNELSRGTFRLQSQYDLVGSSFRNEALRFAQIGVQAPKLDLSNYVMQMQFGTRKFTMGHSTYGTHRHLINNFASRGLTINVPLSARADFTITGSNSTNIVGWSNFLGLSNRRHRLFSGVLGLELQKDNPGGLRFEAGLQDAWFEPRQNFNQANINDAERSRGWSTRILAKNKSSRARLDAGFTRSQFVNPEDPLLNQGQNVVASRSVTRNARYADVSFDLLREFTFTRAAPAANSDANNSVTADSAATSTSATDAQNTPPPAEPKKMNLTLNVRHERVDPLFKSIGATTQADLQQNQVEIVGSFAELNFTASYTQLNDNLAGIQSILRTNTRRAAFVINTPLQGLLSNRIVTQPNPFFPRIGYTLESVRAQADFIPIGGAFDDPASIPDQANLNHALTIDWTLEKFRFGYRLNHTLQDNRQRTREKADLQNFIHGVTFGWNPLPTFDLSFEMNFEDANNRELIRTDRTLRFGLISNWQATQRQSFNLIFSTTGAGDLTRNVRNRNLEFDLQWNYRLNRESENRFRKVQANYFVRYANRYARNRNLLEAVNALTRLNTLTTGLNFIFF